MTNEKNNKANPNDNENTSVSNKEKKNKNKNNNTPQECIVLFVKPNPQSKWILCARAFKAYESAESFAKVNYGDIEIHMVDAHLPQ